MEHEKLNTPQNSPLQQTAVRRSAFDEVRKWDNGSRLCVVPTNCTKTLI